MENLCAEISSRAADIVGSHAGIPGIIAEKQCKRRVLPIDAAFAAFGVVDFQQ
jgi:hypothetical protein